MPTDHANELFRKKEYAGALNAYTSALAPRPAGGLVLTQGYRALLLRNRSCCLFELGRYDEALADADEAISIEPQHATNHWRKVQVLEQKSIVQQVVGSAINRAILEVTGVAGTFNTGEIELAAAKQAAEFGYEYLRDGLNPLPIAPCPLPRLSVCAAASALLLLLASVGPGNARKGKAPNPLGSNSAEAVCLLLLLRCCLCAAASCFGRAG